jgi:glycosyltransferase involved in cell wall biosynthesis
MNKNLKISFIIPVFNEGEFLDQCLDSILGQTYQNFEAVFSDNCSQDHSWDILSRFSQSFPEKIKIHRFDQAVHPFENMKKCMDMATGDLCMHMGGDDYLKNANFLENAIAPFQRDTDTAINIIRLQYFDNANQKMLFLNPPESAAQYLKLSPAEFTEAFIRDTIRDDMFVSVYKSETFKRFLDETIHFSIESSGWWIVLKVFLFESQRGGKFYFDHQANSVLMKRVNNRPFLKSNSACAASVAQIDTPSERAWNSVKYSWQSAMLGSSLHLRLRLLFILFFFNRRKSPDSHAYMGSGTALLLGSPFWGSFYLKLRGAPLKQIFKEELAKLLKKTGSRST